jgi:hypothetical protein
MQSLITSLKTHNAVYPTDDKGKTLLPKMPE